MNMADNHYDASNSDLLSEIEGSEWMSSQAGKILRFVSLMQCPKQLLAIIKSR